jgi:RNA polymerase sigma factor (sigma-70 family)
MISSNAPTDRAGHAPENAHSRELTAQGYGRLGAEGYLPAEAHGAAWAERLAETLRHNIESGRYERACRYEDGRPLSLAAYARRVSAELLSEWEQVEALRQGDGPSWAKLLLELERRAYYWLGPADRSGWARTEACEIAAKTCADLWRWLQHNPFPFDVPFERWAKRALHNRVFESVRAQRTYARYVVDSLDRPTFDVRRTRGGTLMKDDLSAWLEREDHREMLEWALARLDPRQAHIIRLWYLDGWSTEEIAEALEIKVNHLYVLKHRALNQLRRMWEREDGKRH